MIRAYRVTSAVPATLGALLLALVLGAAAGLLGMSSLVLAAPVLLAIIVVWPATGAAALIVACALDRYAISAGGANLRPDELAALALAAALLARVVLVPRRPADCFARPASRAGAAPPLEQSGSAPAGRIPLTAHNSPFGPRVHRTLGASPRPPHSLRSLGADSQFTTAPSGLGHLTPCGRSGPTHDSQLVTRHIPLLLPLLAYVGVNVLSTVNAQGDVVRNLSLDLITLDLVILYIALAAYLTTAERVLSAVRLWLGVSAIEAVVGVAAFALYLATHTVGRGVQLNETGTPMVYGTLYEGNIFGSYMSAAFLIALALVTEDTVRRKAPLLLVCAATAVGLLLSATRSAWGATLVGAVLLLVLLRPERGGGRSRLIGRFVGGLMVVAVVLAVGLAVAPASLTGALGARVQGLLNFASGSGYGRVQLYRVALQEWSAHPLLGLGPGSFSYRLPGDTTPGPAWLPNLTLQALHDTGVIGLLVMVWLFAAFYVTTLRALRRAPPGPVRAVLAGLVAAVTALLIAFQLTPGFTLGYPWAILALAVAGARVSTRALPVNGVIV